MLALECDRQVQTARGRPVHAWRLLQLHASHDSLAGGLLSLLPQGPVCRHSPRSLLAGATPAKRESVTWVRAEMAAATLLLLATSLLQTPTATPATPTAPARVAAEAAAEAEAVMIVVTIAATVATAMTAMTAVVTTMIVMTMTVVAMIAVMIVIAVMTVVVTTVTAETLIETLIETLTEILIITTMIVMSAETAAMSPATIASAAPVRRWTSPRLLRLLRLLRRIVVFALYTNSATRKLG